MNQQTVIPVHTRLHGNGTLRNAIGRQEGVASVGVNMRAATVGGSGEQRAVFVSTASRIRSVPYVPLGTDGIILKWILNPAK